MKLHGFCSECRRPRLVTVSGADLARVGQGGWVPTGICDDCQDEADRKRRTSCDSQRRP